jgi:hypothetical protein
MENTDRPICKDTAEKEPASGQEGQEQKLTWTQIDIEEVTIDGICGVY